ncbi:MAG: hypothetical protein JWP32_1086 [Schumannella sp.]|nr:hypothetical protein [Schumannella sp.]
MYPLPRIVAVLLPLLVVTGCAGGSPPLPTSTAATEPAAAAFVPVPDRNLVTVYDEPFDDNSGDWLEPGWDANVIADGDLSVTEGAGNSHRAMGNVALALMPLYEVQATMDVHGSGLDEVGIYCRLDHGFTGFYRVALGRSGVRITKGVPEDDVPIDLFRAPEPAVGPDLDAVLALACFAEDDGFHVEAFLGGELIAQAVDTGEPPEGGDVRVSWANTPPGDGEGPYVFALRSLLLQTRA